MAPPIERDEVAELYERYGHAIYRRCLTLLGGEPDARELVQETFYQFWKGRDRFEGRSSAFTYLYRIATNLSIDRLRRRTTAGDQVELDETRKASAIGGPDRHAAAMAELAELVKGLDEETLTIAVMAHVDEMTQDEIAESLDLSRRTIGKKLKRFLEHARERAAALGLTPPRSMEPIES
jgi:RNA polymerase sigma-70 factor, ECF subfamily